MTNQKFTAYCGLYCSDCIPSNQELFELLDRMETLLKELKFHEYAQLKSKTYEIFKDYPAFLKVLKEMNKLKCKAICTEGGCKVDCKIRECVNNHKFEGCWECSDFKSCQLLEPLKEFHNLEFNLEMIKKHGPKKWTSYRANHYRWL